MSDNVNIVACSNPFSTEQTILKVGEGLTVSELMVQVQPNPNLEWYAHVYVDEQYIEAAKWSAVVPTAGSLVTIRVVPQGGDDKNPLATILSIVVLVVATVYGGPLGAKLGLEGMIGVNASQAIGTALIGMAGSLLVNAIAPPPTQNPAALSAADAPTLSIAGARNSSGALNVIPKIMGKHLVTPYYGAMPYTELVGQDQYLRLLFVIGYGPLEISDHKIGETDLFDYSDVEIEVRNGYSDDESLTLFPSTVSEESIGTLLE